MVPEHHHMMTVAEYFELDENDIEHRYEYVDGYVYMMAGGTFDHSTISENINRILWNLLREKSCRVYNSDVKVKISQKRYFHPDVTVSCDSRDRGKGDLLQSPRVVFEVLSPSTELKDRTWKLQNYLALPSMQAYVLVSTNAPKMEIYRKENGKWIYDICYADDELELASIDVHFSVKDAYVDIDFPEENPDLSDL
jgi:Uma2 family endonuclease